jgi:polar amino acid transport system permease protein
MDSTFRETRPVNIVIEILIDYGRYLLIGQFPSGEATGLVLTVFLAVIGLVTAFPMAVVLALALASPLNFIRFPATGLVYIVRGLPIVMLVFWAYYALPLITGHSGSALTTMAFALIVYEVPYLAEVIRSGLIALPEGQTEASRSLGLSYWRTMLDVLLPQALFNTIPSIVNQFISLVKNTSIGFIISVPELTYSAYQINGETLVKPLQVYAVLALIYFVLCFSISRFAVRLESRVVARRTQSFVPQDLTRSEAFS